VWQPYLGCREFPAFFELVEVGEETPAAAGFDQDLGYMLYDVFDLSKPGHEYSTPAISLFQARVCAGVMQVPPFDSPEVVKARGGAAHA
jgi:CRISPR-associated protein Cas5d